MSNLHSHLLPSLLLEMGSTARREGGDGERPGVEWSGVGCFAIKSSSVKFGLGVNDCAVHLGLEIEMLATTPRTAEVLIALCTSV